MQYFVHAVGHLLSDLASTVLFLIIVIATGDVPSAILAGMALGAAQIGWELWRGRRVETMQWLSLGLVLGSGGVALLTGDARIVMLKPSLIYLIIGAVMLKRGWMTRYMPPIVQKLVPDVVEGFGFLWAGLMILSAGLNIVLALRLDPVQWASVMAVYALVSKLALFLVQFTVMKVVARRRVRRGAAI